MIRLTLYLTAPDQELLILSCKESAAALPYLPMTILWLQGRACRLVILRHGKRLRKNMHGHKSFLSGPRSPRGV